MQFNGHSQGTSICGLELDSEWRLCSLESSLRILVTRVRLSPLFFPSGTADVTVVIPILAGLTSRPSAGTSVTADRTGVSFRGERPSIADSQHLLF